MQKNIQIFDLDSSNAHDLTKMIGDDRPEYRRFFIPFSFDEESISARLAGKAHDRYWGIHCDRQLAGFFMLRGFDEGHANPAFGVYVAEKFTNFGIASAALFYAIAWCKLNEVPALILKVHASNTRAYHLFVKAGFKFVTADEKAGYDVLEMPLLRSVYQ